MMWMKWRKSDIPCIFGGMPYRQGSTIIASLCLLLTCPVRAQNSIEPSPWPATDALGRKLPTADEVGPPRRDRFVGIFYFLWHNDPKSHGTEGPRDIAKIFAADPDAMKHPDSKKP